MNNINFQQAKISNDYKYIIDSDNNKVKLDDPRVVHIWPIATGVPTTQLIKRAFEKRGWNFRFTTTEANSKGLQYAKKLCSGRECLSCISMAGETYRDIKENRKEDEISLYYNFDIISSCQSGAWPYVWDTFSERLNLKNAVFMGSTNLDNSYMGQGDAFAKDLLIAIVIGDILDEAEASLKCLAKDKETAMAIMESENEKVYKSHLKGFKDIDLALAEWAHNISKIPLKATIEETPKVLIFGGMAVVFIHHQISEYFLNEGVIPKVEEISLGLSFIQARYAVRYGIERGIIDPSEQLEIKNILFSMLNPKNNFQNAKKALHARINMFGIDYLIKRFRKIAAKSGLLFYTPIPLMKVAKHGNKIVSYSTDAETPLIAGYYDTVSKSKTFDGLVNASYFTCLPSMNAQGIIRSLASSSDIPFAGIDCDGPNISANHRRLLETVALRAKKMRKEKNK
ncbi:MAG: hypothetical protein HQK76_13400 [Desulfobacterales bacterium]|nr:hypothetical protein [Desulfobacterales bacterium]